MRRHILVLIVLMALPASAGAQLVVYDPAVTLQNTITAALKEYLIELQRQQHSELRRMAHRLSNFTSLRKYALNDVPLWRTHEVEGPTFLFSFDYNGALNFGDASGASFLAVSHAVENAASALGRLSPAAGRELLSRLATIDVSGSAAIAATHDTGRLRYNGRREFAAIEGLQRDATDDSLEQSATAVLDKISGAALIGGRQRQARIQLLSGMVEQLLMESKRARDTETGVMNMQLVAWRDRAAANQAFVAGTGDALRSWRQP
jgi:hypothetical protein